MLLKLTENRSFVIEKIIDKFPKTPCKFEGCSFNKADRELVIYHEIGCANRLVACGLCESAQVNLSRSAAGKALFLLCIGKTY